MRTPIALALVLAACGPADRRDAPVVHGAPTVPQSPGPDPIVLRVAGGGGVARAYAYPQLDSAVWRSAQRVPPLARILAFDQDAGLIAFVDTAGLPGRVDLRLGKVQRASKTKLASLASANGYGIFGIQGKAVARLTPTDTRPWSYTPPVAARELFPQPDGSLIVVAARGDSTAVWRIRPPERAIVDSAMLPRTGRGIRTAVGDRIYFTTDSGLLALRDRDLAPAPPIRFGAPVRALAPTPSGNRLYVALDSSGTLQVVNRYRDEIEERIELPGAIAELRMDPLGRYLLARPARGDSAWVVAIGTDRLLGSVRTAWRADLPFVAPDGAIALAQGKDVVFVDGETLRPQRTVAGGASDYWHVLLWNGFRPRTAGPTELATEGDGERDVGGDAIDSALGAASAATSTDSAPPPPSALDTARAVTTPPTAAPGGAAVTGFVVQFAAVRAEGVARQMAAQIRVDGQAARVLTTQTAGTPIYRVVLGPYATKQDAERVGRSAGRDYWVYEGIP